jgi:site-specific recombinase XerD
MAFIFHIDTHQDISDFVPEKDPCIEPEDRTQLRDSKRRRVLEHGLQRLSGEDLPGRDHASRYLHHKYRQHLSAGTIRSTVSFLLLFLTYLKENGRDYLEEVSREDLEAFVEHEQDRGLHVQSVSAKVKQLKAFCRFLIEEQVVRAEVLFKRLTIRVPDGLPRAMEPEDMRRLLSVIESDRDLAMVLVLLRTGMRIGELLEAKMADVLLEERKIFIFEAQKNRVGRTVYLSDDAYEALKAWQNERDPRQAYLFYCRDNMPMGYTTARKIFCKYLHKAGLDHKGYTLHCLRHTFATELLNAGMRIECLQVLLGHATLQMTRRYARLSDKTREEEYFRAMARIEKEASHGNDELDCELQALFEAEELLRPHD